MGGGGLGFYRLNREREIGSQEAAFLADAAAEAAAELVIPRSAPPAEGSHSLFMNEECNAALATGLLSFHVWCFCSISFLCVLLLPCN